MGNSQPYRSSYSVSVKNSERPNCSAVFRAATHPDGLVENVPQKMNNEWEIFLRGLKAADGSGRCIGYRKRFENNELDTKYTWLSYNEIYQMSLNLGTNLQNKIPQALQSMAFIDETYKPAQNLSFFGIHSKNCYEWFVCEFTAAAYNWTLVPLYDSLSNESIEYILEQTQMKFVASSLDCLQILLNATKKTKTLTHIMLFTHPHQKVPESLLELSKSCNIEIIYFNDFVNDPGQIKEPTPGDIDSVNTVCYTSGTTGLPKGAILTQLNIISCLSGLCKGPIQNFLFLSVVDTTISYLPLAHVLERLVSCMVISLGASIGVYSGDNGALLDDIKILEPSIFVSVPRLLNRINDAVFRNVAGKAPLSRYLFSQAKNWKLDSLRSTATTTSSVWDPLVFNKTRKMMGTKLRYIICGGAPLDPLVQEHIEILFCAPLLEGYGLTETFGPASLANAKDPLAGHVGGPLPSVEFKLISEPALEYYATDPEPKGELLIRGPSVSLGYFQNPEATKAVIDEDGWFHTGDIAVLLPNGAIKIIDRKKNIFKLSQGEYVAVEKIENVYLQCTLLSQIFVFGYSTKRYLVAIVVPDEKVVTSWRSSHKIPNKSAKGVSNDLMSDLKEAILTEMSSIAKQANLKGFEKVKDIWIESEPFTIDNGLLTPTLKLKRFNATKKYKSKIDELYKNEAEN